MIDDDAFEELPEHEPAWAALDRVTIYRKQLLASGYSPVPVNGKRVHLSDWPNIRATNAIIETWATTRADHLNTGVLCRDTPFIDIDVTDEEVAEEIEALFESEIENSAVRIGLPPKRAIPFRTDTPFKKIATQFKDPNGLVHKVEVLGDGQMCVVDGIHPDTHKPYRWHGGEPGPKLRREDLPLITAETAAAFIAAAAKIMRDAGWTEIESKKTNGKINDTDRRSNAGRAESASIRERAYAQAALDGCAEELADTAAGDRNNILYKKSFRIGTMAARSWIARSEAEAALFDAAAACGLVSDDGEAQTRRTIKSGLDDGATAPHPDLDEQKNDGEKWEDAAATAQAAYQIQRRICRRICASRIRRGRTSATAFLLFTHRTNRCRQDCDHAAVIRQQRVRPAIRRPGDQTGPRALSRGRKCRRCAHALDRLRTEHGLRCRHDRCLLRGRTLFAIEIPAAIADGSRTARRRIRHGCRRYRSHILRRRKRERE